MQARHWLVGRGWAVGVLIVTIMLAGCTSPAVSRAASGRAEISSRPCSHLGGVTWGQVVRTRAVTAANLVIVRGGSSEVLPIAGLEQLGQQLSPASGAAPDVSELLSSLQVLLPIETTPGPDTEPVTAYDLAALAPGRYITFTGADLGQARYTSTCATGSGGARSAQLTGTLSTWFTRAVGIVQCTSSPPQGSTARLVLKYCGI